MTGRSAGRSLAPVIDSARAALLRWYDQNARDLPWRRTGDPYAIWVSEVMLQQTRVETVIPYFERFMARFPTPERLAAAGEDEVLSCWSGLGYYRRARLLHRGVAEAVAAYGGVPEDREARRALPGVGAYTAGAIGSIAFGLPEPIVDGNVARVLARFHAVGTPLGESRTDKRLWALAGEWVVGPRPGALNQALMELGATVCAKVAPRCADCPLRERCEARAAGTQASLPVPASKKPPKPVELAAAVLVDADGRWLLVRSEAALFGGLYGFPSSEFGLEGLREQLGGWVRGLVLEPRKVGEVQHVLSHRKLAVSVYRGRLESLADAPAGVTARMLSADELANVGVARLTQKVLEATDAGPPTKPTRKPRAAARSRASAAGRAAAGASADPPPASPSSPARPRRRAPRAS